MTGRSPRCPAASAGLTELSVELEPSARGQGRGVALVRAAVAAAPEGLVLAAVAPGNAASLRAFLAAGFTVLGSTQLLRPARRLPGRAGPPTTG